MQKTFHVTSLVLLDGTVRLVERRDDIHIFQYSQMNETLTTQIRFFPLKIKKMLESLDFATEM